MSKTRITLAAFAVLLSACGPDPDMPMKQRQARQRQADQWQQSREAQPIPETDGQRVTVERIGVFADDLAYGNRRGVYVIRDTKTGREFIGVSGVGIAETGSHQSGKAHVNDER